ncbi:pentatricopeptide repeat-containing protein At3g18110, chloroplastic-like isoform X1 [Chenopodium quinoa]|uniref:pentatricopeptide repeat-containing protein At3g18110, chloroplastic-like isoform X1 n=2 Tax=Chenopodium quinoa TaxID=63459 RepID=UPI000B78D95F|nr:pentatricopeptide repeat-containing protein At3g18110, chloroplastic-like isoform X1 [Chenopodium quinoa]XP_021774804.1 pentatricopeptide repeat-containing protein At3g18110, chloroplastic-like isoform X1 [Chenopodium quinoa]
MAITNSGTFAVSASPLHIDSQSKVRRCIPSYCTLASSSSSASIEETTVEESTNPKKFSYSRASPSVRWPNLKIAEIQQSTQTHYNLTHNLPTHLAKPANDSEDEEEIGVEDDGGGMDDIGGVVNDENLEVLGRTSKTKVKKMTKLALKRAKDWRKRVQFLTDKILGLGHDEFVADVLDKKMVQMTPTDYCFVVKWVGQSSWQRALEVYEWLNLRHWYSPNARMLATILAVLGKANQEGLAVEIFARAEPSAGNTVQVYNAMMGVYARNARFSKVQEMLNLMRERGCEPDLVSFNTLINARLKSGSIGPNLGMDLLNEVRKSGIRPDTITYNTLISACSRESNLQEAIKVYADMEANNCQPDLWTYNAMISVFARCGLASRAERILRELEAKGFLPDAVTYNSILYAFAREGNTGKVGEICETMLKRGFVKDEMTYNTILNMYGKHGELDTALDLYRNMKSSGLVPDAVTYTVLIDCLGKANRMFEAANLMSEMLDGGVKPTLRTFSALICGYGKSGNRVEAEETFNCMLRSGIKPDKLAYSVMMDILSRSGEAGKAMALYRDMVRNNFMPDHKLYLSLIQLLKKENKDEGLQKIILDMQQLCGMTPVDISSALVQGECYDEAGRMLRLAAAQGYDLNHKDLLSVLSSFSSSGRHVEAEDLLKFMRDHASSSQELVEEALVIVFCKANQLDAALEQYYDIKESGLFSGSCMMFESLIICCKENELFSNASQIFSDMKFLGIEPSYNIYESMVCMYCHISFPETAQWVIDEAEGKGIIFKDVGIFVNLIEAYGSIKELQKVESIVARLRQRSKVVDRRVWNAIIQAYAASGCYEQARAAFNTMMRDGPSPTIDTINLLMQALIVDGRLNELYVLIQELQDIGFKISKSTILLMLEAFAKAGNIFEVKKIYNGMRAAGYLPNMHLYRIMIGLLSRGKRVRDVEVMVAEMEEAGFKPDISMWNLLLKMYTSIEDNEKTAEVFKKIREAGLVADEDTYNTLILMYCRDRRPEEGLRLMHDMRKRGMDLKLDTCKSLIAACSKQQLSDKAEELFDDLQAGGFKLDRSFYHLMIKMYRDSGRHDKAERLFNNMKEVGVEPTIATMHLLMMSYGSSGQPKEAEKVLDNLKLSGHNLSTLPYSSVIDAFLKQGDYNAGIEKLLEMKDDGLEPDHRIWTCFIYAASLCQSSEEAMALLLALQDTGFDLPVRLLTENWESSVTILDHWIERLEPLEDNAAFNFVNALENLLWAFELRATASLLFQLAVKRRIYKANVFRVAEKDWGADFRKLSAGAALVGLTLWLDLMQDASLEGSPESPKSVVLITGTAEYNMVSLNSTLKAYLWEMGSPFLPCRTRSGLLIAKAHSLRMWLKDSPFCFDLELKNAPSLPQSNSMQLMEGCFMRRGLVPAFTDIAERLGEVRPKKFARLALLSDDKREKAIQADIDGRKEKLDKMKSKGGVTLKRKVGHQKRKFVRKTMASNTKKMLPRFHSCFCLSYFLVMDDLGAIHRAHFKGVAQCLIQTILHSIVCTYMQKPKDCFTPKLLLIFQALVTSTCTLVVAA